MRCPRGARTSQPPLSRREIGQPRCFGYHASSFFIRDFGLGKSTTIRSGVSFSANIGHLRCGIVFCLTVGALRLLAGDIRQEAAEPR